MNLNVRELTLIRNTLLARKAYRNTEIPLGAKPWEEWMGELLSKIDNAIQSQS